MHHMLGEVVSSGSNELTKANLVISLCSEQILSCIPLSTFRVCPSAKGHVGVEGNILSKVHTRHAFCLKFVLKMGSGPPPSPLILFSN